MDSKALDKKRIELATQLRIKRENKDISQEALGKSLNISRIEISRIESGVVKNIDTYIRVAQALGMDLQIRATNTQTKVLSKYE